MKLKLYVTGALWIPIMFALLCLPLPMLPEDKSGGHAMYLLYVAYYCVCIVGGTLGPAYAQCEGFVIEGATTIRRLFGLTALLLSILWTLSLTAALCLLSIRISGPYDGLLGFAGLAAAMVAFGTPGIAAFLLHAIVADGHTRKEFALDKGRSPQRTQDRTPAPRSPVDQAAVRRDAIPTGKAPLSKRQQPERRD